MTPTERDKNRYAIIARVSEEVEEAPATGKRLSICNTFAALESARSPTTSAWHLDDEDLRAEESRVLEILAITEKSPLPARALLDAASLRLNQVL